MPLLEWAVGSLIVAGIGKLYHGSKKEKFQKEQARMGNRDAKYGFGDFLSDSVSDLREQADKHTGNYNSAYKSSNRYSDSELRDKYNSSSGAEKAGYGNALKERIEERKGG